MLFICVVTAAGETVETVVALEVASAAIACDRAMAIARGYSRGHGYQIWRNGRKLAAYYAPPVAPAVAMAHRPLTVVPFSRRVFGLP